MTEAEWLTCDDPRPMLEFLRGKASDRKQRLFAAACCRRIWRHLKDERSRRLVEIAEAFADGMASSQQLRAAFDEAGRAQDTIHWEGGDAVDQGAAEAVLGLREKHHLAQVLGGITEVVGEARAAEVWDQIYGTQGKDWRTQEAEHQEAYDAGAAAEQIAQAALLRDITLSAFRAPASGPSSWLAWNDGAVRKLAQVIYDERGFDRLPLLADALEDAGCTDADILGHCRGGGEHVRGCWVIDLLLGKN